jgi:hypothetical protein
MLFGHERRELLGDGSADQLIDGDAFPSRQLPDLFVERVRKPETQRAHGDLSDLLKELSWGDHPNPKGPPGCGRGSRGSRAG